MSSAFISHDQKLTTKDGYTLYTRWHVNETSRAIAVLVHGLGEHSGRYDHIVEVFTQRGIGVVRYDLRGHGKSTGQRGYIANYNQLLDDLSLVLDIIRKQYSVRPLIAYGHSLGGGVVANWCLRRVPSEHGVVAAVLSSPWFTLTSTPPAWQVFLIKNTARIWPWFIIPARFRVKDLCRDKEMIEQYKHDSLKHQRITVKLAIECHLAGQYALNHAGEFPIPALAIHGLKDKITSPGGTSLFCDLSPQTDLLLFKDMVHETHNEPGWKIVVNQVADWIDQSVSLNMLKAEERMNRLSG